MKRSPTKHGCPPELKLDNNFLAASICFWAGPPATLRFAVTATSFKLSWMDDLYVRNK